MTHSRLVTYVFLAIFGAAYSGSSVTSAQGGNANIYEPGNGVSLPRVLKLVKAEYTPEAKAARIQGTVTVGAVVQADGTVGDVAIVRSLDAKLGLDQAALDATKQSLFEPGKKDGKPVAVRITIEHTFALK